MDNARILIKVNGRAVLLIVATRGMTITEFAEKAGMNKQHVVRLVKGEKLTTPETAKRIQRALAPAQWHDLFALASTGTEAQK